MSEEISPEHHHTTFAQAAPPVEDDPFAAYQAALAAAAHKAAGRQFPPRVTSALARPGPDSGAPRIRGHGRLRHLREPPPFDSDDYERDDVDFDLDLDDDDIIAEANARRWPTTRRAGYANELGFYSDPTPQQGLPFENADGGSWPSQAAGRGEVLRDRTSRLSRSGPSTRTGTGDARGSRRLGPRENGRAPGRRSWR